MSARSDRGTQRPEDRPATVIITPCSTGHSPSTSHLAPRLHGDARGTIDRSRNKPGDPIVGHNDEWEQTERSRLSFDPIVFTDEQRRHAELALLNICLRGEWTYHTAACQHDHVHALISARVEPKPVRRWLKRWLGDSLTEKWPLESDQTWWSEGGSIKWIWDDWYLDAVWQYIEEQRVIEPNERQRSVSP